VVPSGETWNSSWGAIIPAMHFRGTRPMTTGREHFTNVSTTAFNFEDENLFLKTVAGVINHILWHCFTHHSSGDESAKE
jgi:hypothetical protein